MRLGSRDRGAADPSLAPDGLGGRESGGRRAFGRADEHGAWGDPAPNKALNFSTFEELVIIVAPPTVKAATSIPPLATCRDACLTKDTSDRTSP